MRRTVRAVTQVNPIRPRNTKMGAASLPKMVKPARMVKAQAQAAIRLPGVSGDGAYRERGRGTWETRRAGVVLRELRWECITTGLHGRESEGVIVAGKRGNARGARDPCR